MKDLTKGNESSLIFYFALPMILGNVFQQLYNTIDSVIVGRFIGKKALAALQPSFPITFLLISLIMGITMGSTILISQYYGAENLENVKKTIDTTYVFLFFSSIIITIIGVIFSERILILLNTPAEVITYAKTYLRIIFLGTALTFGYNSVSAILRGLGDSKTPLYFLIISTIVNLFLDLLFILKFKWGIAGAAWATVIAQGISFILSIIYLSSKNEFFKFNIKNMNFDKYIFKMSIKIGLPSGIQQMLVAAGMMALSKIVNGFGTDVSAAFGAAGKLDSFASMPAMNISSAVSTFVGQNIGANKPYRVKKGYISGVIISSTISLIITMIVLLFGKELMGIFTTDSNVKAIGGRYFAIVGAFYIVFSAMFVTNGLLKGAGETIIPMFSSILSLWIIRVPVSAFLSKKIGVDGIWWGIPIGWLGGLVLSYVYYLTGKWKNKCVIKNNI